MPVVLRSLSDFKKFLRKPGATLQIVQNTFVDRQDAESRAAYRSKGLYEPRTLRALSKKAAVFDVKGTTVTVGQRSLTTTDLNRVAFQQLVGIAAAQAMGT